MMMYNFVVDAIDCAIEQRLTDKDCGALEEFMDKRKRERSQDAFPAYQK